MSNAAAERRVARIALGLIAAIGSVEAHEFALTEVRATFLAPATYRIDVVVDVDALALGVSPATDSAEVAARLRAMDPQEFDDAVELARHTLSRRLRVRFDGEKQQPLVTFPEYGSTLDGLSAVPTLLGTTARLSGEIPHGARTFSFGASRSFKQVRLSIFDERSGARSAELLDVAEDSPPFVLGQPAARPRFWPTVRRYGRLGFEHILPHGLDHVLFVLGLFLLSPRLRPLLWQISGFTVAHTVTLALSTYGLISLPPRLVEPLIALSIAYVAIENLFTERLQPWRPVLVFGFGLLHGMGFAGVLRELGLPQEQFAAAVLSFNLGVEFGQLAVILLAWIAVGWYRGSEHYRRRVAIPGSTVIAGIGLVWAVQRGLGL